MREESWLCDAAGRERLLEMSDWVRRVRAGTFALQAIVLLVCGPTIGWVTLLPFSIAVCGFTLGDLVIGRVRRPELVYASCWVVSQGMVGVGIAITGGARSPLAVWLAVPVATLASRFTVRGLAAGVVVTIAILTTAMVGSDPAGVLAYPAAVLMPACAVCGVALLGSALMRSDVHHRTESVVDPLTQLLNRKALAGRVLELQQQAALTGEPVGLLAFDLDHFKAVNDRHGHPAGDAVLAGVAERVRGELRAFDLAYRLGGEEFLVVLPGAGLREAAALAEGLRAAVAREPVAGVPITVSFGVAATAPGERFAFDELFARADEALYAAKRAGRNRVGGAPPAAPAARAA